MDLNNSHNSETILNLQNTLKAIEILNATMDDYRNQSRAVGVEMENLELRLKEAQSKRLRLEDNIKTTEESVARLESVADSLRAATSPVRRLPAEVLLRIFHYVGQNSILLLEADLARWTYPRATGKGAFALTSVCTVWRKIMISNPSVWPPFSLTAGGFAENLSEQDVRRFNHWMKACPPSRQRLLLVDFILEDMGRINSLIGTSSVSWNAIDIIVKRAAEGRWDIEKLRAKSVAIYRGKDLSIQYFVPLMRYATELTIFGRPPEWEALPWIALKVLTIKPFASNGPPSPISFGPTSFTDLLHAATQLTDLTLDFPVEERTLDTAEPRSFTHSKLHSISFHLHHCSTNGRLFGVQLDAPSIRKATLLTLKRQNVSDDASFYRTWDAPSHLVLPRLKDFELADTAELTRWYPHIDTLEVEGPNIDALFVFLHTLFHRIPPQSEPLPLPRLTSLIITNTDVRGETLIELVENRLRHVQAQTPNVRPITRITMYDSPGVTPSHWTRVQELLEEGRKPRNADWR